MKIETQNPWPFSNVVNFHHSKPLQKNGVDQHQQKKHMKDSHLPQPLLDFLAPIDELFHLPFLVLDLNTYVLIQLHML